MAHWFCHAPDHMHHSLSVRYRGSLLKYISFSEDLGLELHPIDSDRDVRWYPASQVACVHYVVCCPCNVSMLAVQHICAHQPPTGHLRHRPGMLHTWSLCLLHVFGANRAAIDMCPTPGSGVPSYILVWPQAQTYASLCRLRSSLTSVWGLLVNISRCAPHFS